MKINVNESQEIEITEVFNPINLRTPDGEQLTICMRDSGFEFQYEGVKFYAKKGVISKI